jgi:hypothetical protein
MIKGIPKRPLAFAGALAAAFFLLAAAAWAQRGFFRVQGDDVLPVFDKNAEFHFVRTEYVDLPGFRRGFGSFVSRNGRANGWWAQDWPDADNHFTTGIQRLTRINIGEPRHVALTDDELYEYPWIYLTQAANCNLSDAEIKRLREYLNRGGFLMVDDFWQENEWETFAETVDRVFPGRPIPDIQLSDPVMNVLYNIEAKDLTFIPGSRHLGGMGSDGRATVRQPAGTMPAWRGVYDDKNRMVIAVNFNTDIGDAWEFADVPYYPAEMTILAYRYGINYITYAMTH